LCAGCRVPRLRRHCEGCCRCEGVLDPTHARGCSGLPPARSDTDVAGRLGVPPPLLRHACRERAHLLRLVRARVPLERPLVHPLRADRRHQRAATRLRGSRDAGCSGEAPGPPPRGPSTDPCRTDAGCGGVVPGGWRRCGRRRKRGRSSSRRCPRARHGRSKRRRKLPPSELPRAAPPQQTREPGRGAARWPQRGRLRPSTRRAVQRGWARQQTHLGEVRRKVVDEAVVGHVRLG